MRKPEDFAKRDCFNLSTLVESDKLGMVMIQMGHKNNLEEQNDLFCNLVSILNLKKELNAISINYTNIIHKIK